MRGSPLHRRVLILGGTVLLALSGCSSGPSNQAKSSATPTAVSTPTPAPTPAPAVKAKSPSLPVVETIKRSRGVLASSIEADWVLVAFGKVWISPVGVDQIEVFDARSGRQLAPIPVPQGPCAALAADSKYVWTATCTERGVVRLDPVQMKVTGFHEVAVPTDGESSIGAADGLVWAIANSSDCTTCLAVGIDSETLATKGSYPIPRNASAVRAGLGGVWITYRDENSVVHLDPAAGRVISTVRVAAGPRFLDVGEGSVWVLTQRAGALCRITPTDQLAGCTQLDQFGTDGGDLTVGAGYVWYRATDSLVVQVNPRDGRVVRRIGDPEGSGSASAGSGQLWITAHDRNHIYRVPVRG